MEIRKKAAKCANRLLIDFSPSFPHILRFDIIEHISVIDLNFSYIEKVNVMKIDAFIIFKLKQVYYYVFFRWKSYFFQRKYDLFSVIDNFIARQSVRNKNDGF